MSLDKMNKICRKKEQYVFLEIHYKIKLSTCRQVEKMVEIDLYTKLYTLSTENRVDIIVYIVFLQNGCFGKYAKRAYIGR